MYQILKRDGYNVSVVQNPTISLTGDVATTRAVLDDQDGPAVLVGHSYGGAVISEAGNHPNVISELWGAARSSAKPCSALGIGNRIIIRRAPKTYKEIFSRTIFAAIIASVRLARDDISRLPPRVQ